MDILFFKNALDVACDISLKYFNKDYVVKSKNDNSPVTICDLEIEKKLRNLINDNFNNHGIIGEEFAEQVCSSEFQWIIDPIDGTKAFVEGRETFSNMICVLKNGVPIASAIGFPMLNKQFIAINGKTYLNGVQTHAITYDENNANLAYTGKYMFMGNEIEFVEKFENKFENIILGNDSYAYCSIAEGKNTVVVESDLKIYDIMPLVPIVKNSGGVIYDWNNNEIKIDSGPQIIAGPKNFNNEFKTTS